MPRQARQLVDGGYYHIITRGIDRRRLFRYFKDYQFFLEVITKYLSKFKVAILHYCLMSNHVHLLVKVERKDDLPKFMQGILQVYASYFRKKYKSVGFVFQNRYKSRLIDNDNYLIECGRYIERNPLRENIITDLSTYRWSSFLFYAESNKDGIIKNANPLYLELAQTEKQRQEHYRDYVCISRPYEDIIDKALRI